MKKKITRTYEEIPENRILQKTISPQNISFKRDKMLIDDQYTRTYYISQYPSNANFKWLENIANLIQDVITTVHIQDVNQDVILKQIEARYYHSTKNCKLRCYK